MTEPHAGAMIALIPTKQDAARLAVDGGEPADELHVTLTYLGQADQLDAAARQELVTAVARTFDGMPAIEGNAFGLASFGQAGPEPCNVLNVGGDMLDAAHHLLYEMVPMPPGAAEQHAPWHAHLTLEYTADISRLATYVDRLGPIRFNRVRIAFGGDILDIPLADADEPDGDDGYETWLAEQGLTEAKRDDNSLKRYFLTDPRGQKRWAVKAHPWTALFRIIKRHVPAERAKRIASAWYREFFGHMPNQKRPALAEAFDPDQARAGDGKWSKAGFAHAAMKIGKSALRLEHHGDGNISVHDEHGGTLRLSHGRDLSSPKPGGFRNFAFGAALQTEQPGDRDWLTKTETRGGKPWTTVLAGLEKTHVARDGEPGLHDQDEPYLNDLHTLHLAPGGKGVDDPAELFARPGVSISTKELGDLADHLETYARTQARVDTGHGQVTMQAVGKEFTLDPGHRGQAPITLTRGELRNVEKALNAAYEAHNPDEGDPLPADQAFSRTIPTKASGDIVVTRPSPDSDFWVESDTTAVRITPDAFHNVSYQLDAMLGAGSSLSRLTPVTPSAKVEAAKARPVVLAEATFGAVAQS